MPSGSFSMNINQTEAEPGELLSPERSEDVMTTFAEQAWLTLRAVYAALNKRGEATVFCRIAI